MNGKSKILGSATQLVVADVVKTAEFYRDQLGFKIVDYFLDPPVYAMVERNGIQVHFGKADHDSVQQSNVPLRQVGFDLYFWVSDIEALFEEFSSKDVKIIEPLTTRVYGNVEFSVRDLNGFKLVFGQESLS